MQENAGEEGYHFRGVDRNLRERVANRVITTVNNVLGRFGIFIPGLASRPDIAVSPFVAIYRNIARGILDMLVLFALGVLIIGLIAMVPIFGNIISLAAFIIALGAALVTRFRTIQGSSSVCSIKSTGD